MSASSWRLRGWARSLLAPRERLLPGLGYRLDRHPRLGAAAFLTLRRLPGRRLRSLAYAHVSRPLARRMSADLVVPVDGGFRMRLDMSDVVGSVLATSGVWEPYVVAALARELLPGDVYVDVGAHVGYHALVAAKIVGPRGHVYALEPSPNTFRDLCANLELNGVPNVTALAVAAGASEGYVSLIASELDNVGGTTARLEDRGELEKTESVRVEIRPLASVLDPVDVARLRLVKIDVEGLEAEVLEGLEPLFVAGARASVIVELHPNGAANATSVLERLPASYGLRIFELARNPHLDRFAPVPPPRPLRDADEMLALCEDKTTNVLLAAGRAASQ